MKRDRKYLDEAVFFTIMDVHRKGKNKSVMVKAKDELKDYFSNNRIIQIFNGNVPIAVLNELELYNVSDFLLRHELLKIDLSEYYHKEEMDAAVNSKSQIEYDSSNGVVFKDMEFNENELKPQWVGFISYQEIGSMFDAGIFNYNFATQRKAKVLTIRNQTERIATVNQENVDAICDEVLKGKFEENMLTLNIRIGEGERYLYDPDGKDLWIPDGIEIDTIDGYHRICGIHKAWKQNKNIKGKMVLLIKHISAAQAKYFIAQEAKGTINAQEDMKIYDSSGNMYKLINEINKNSNDNNIFFNNIDIDESVQNPIVYYDPYATVMNLAWGEELSRANMLDLYDIRDFICDFYSLVYQIYMKKYKVEKLEELEGENILNQTFISGLLFPAYNLYVKNNGQIDIDAIRKMVNNTIKLDRIEEYVYKDSTNKFEFNPYVDKWKSILR